MELVKYKEGGKAELEIALDELSNALVEAYFEGRYSMATYNDVEVSDPDEDFAASSTADVIEQYRKRVQQR